MQNKDLKNKENGKTSIIIGAGSSLSTYSGKVSRLLFNHNTFSIGINNIIHTVIPDYHLWTNKKRLSQFGDNISESSCLVIGSGIPEKLIQSKINRDYCRLQLIDQRNEPLHVSDDEIRGSFRTAGCVGIVLAHFMGASNIYVAGMDGYTLYNKKSLDKKKANHHCYGSGYTDDAEWEDCLEKDRLVSQNLRNIYEYGIDFKIVTPTKFSKFHDSTILDGVMHEHTGYNI